MNNGMIYVLLVVSIISIVISVVSLVLILNVIKKQNILLDFAKRDVWKVKSSQQENNNVSMMQGSNQVVRKQGIIICKKCYAPVSESCTTCPACKSSVGRR